MAGKKSKTLYRKLLEMKAEILIARRKAEDFKDEVALNNVIHALDKAAERFKNRRIQC